MSSAVSFRPATSTFEDGRAFAHYLDLAADGIFRAILGRRSKQILAKAFLEPGHDLSYEHVIFAVSDDSIVGMLSAYSGRQHHESSARPLLGAAGLAAIRLMTFRVLFASMVRVLDSIEPDAFYIQAIAVDAAARGRGVGSILMKKAEGLAQKHAANRLCLDVAAENAGARRLYERCGMTVQSRWPKRLRLGSLKLLRMGKTLNGRANAD